MRDLMPPLFQLLTGLGFIVFLVVNLKTRKHLTDTPSKLFGFAMVLVAAGLFCMSAGTGAHSLGNAGPMLITAGAAFFLSSLFVGAGLVLLARRAGQ
ncbi:MAG: hypothetical protein AB7L41_02855 [Flavobacteriaceae bacterium]